jgi:hypothetical protein
MTLNETVRITGQIAEGLDHAHKKGVIHRDFKPSNVLLDSHGNAYLADFGIAKIAESTINLTGSGVVGTPAYMAPEMADRGLVTPAVDIYALGVTAYEMLTGHFPFTGETPLRVMMAHATEPIPDIREDRPDLPEAVAEVLKRALAKNPDDRFSTAAALVEALKDAGHGVMPERVDSAGTVMMPMSGSMDTSTSPSQSTEQGFKDAGTPVPVTPLPEKKRGGCGSFFAGSVAAIVGVVVLVLLCIGGIIGLAVVASNSATPTFIPIPTNTQRPPTDVPPPPPTAAASGVEIVPDSGGTGSSGSGIASLEVVNNSNVELCSLYVDLASADPGDDQLDADQTIPAGTTFTLTDLPYGTYNVEVWDCPTAHLYAGEYDAAIDTATVTWTLESASLEVINDSSNSICELYIISSSASFWGYNRLDAGQTLAPGSTLNYFLAEGAWDLRAVACDASIGETTNIGSTIEGDMTWTLFDE